MLRSRNEFDSGDTLVEVKGVDVQDVVENALDLISLAYYPTLSYVIQ